MRIVFDRGNLRLHVSDADVLHPEALETWREASALSKICMAVLPSDEVDDTCQLLAGVATHSLTAGRDDQVINIFQEVDRKIRNADEALRRTVIDNIVAIFLFCVLYGFLAGSVWMLMEQSSPWKFLPKGIDLLANYIFLIIGWAGFTLIGFGIGWFFIKTGEVRVQDRAGVVKLAPSLKQRRAHIAYNASVCVIIVIVMFFFEGFDKINQMLSQQLDSAPWAILLGLVAGITEPAVFERIRGFLKLS